MIARQAGYSPAEINASDERGKGLKERLDSLVSMKAHFTDGRPNCVIMDEIDGCQGAEGAGAVDILLKYIRDTNAAERARDGKAKKWGGGGRGGRAAGRQGGRAAGQQGGRAAGQQGSRAAGRRTSSSYGISLSCLACVSTAASMTAAKPRSADGDAPPVAHRSYTSPALLESPRAANPQSAAANGPAVACARASSSRACLTT